jgi:hypothetical protein
MPNVNHNLAFRPLLAGIGIYNPIVNEVGTLGAFGTSDGQDRWLISCYHVVARTPASLGLTPFSSGEPIFQGSAHDGIVARTDVTRSDRVMDCAAARLEPGLGSSRSCVDIGTVNGIASSLTAGMRLLKSGAETGVTEGVVSRVETDRIFIERPVGFPNGYLIAGKGDSGSVWVTADTRQLVALHLGVRTIDGVAITLPIAKVLAVMTLRTI